MSRGNHQRVGEMLWVREAIGVSFMSIFDSTGWVFSGSGRTGYELMNSGVGYISQVLISISPSPFSPQSEARLSLCLEREKQTMGTSGRNVHYKNKSKKTISSPDITSSSP